MRVGIYTHYAHCDQAYLGVRLVEFLRTRGVDFEIYSDCSPAKLRLPYDKTVSHRKREQFTDWAKRQSTIVWTHVPRVEQLRYANQRGITTVLAPMWQELTAPFRKAMTRADQVVALSSESLELFRDVYKIKSAVYLPYDAGLPVTKKDKAVDGRNVKILLPWYDRNAKCANSELLSMLAYLFEHMPDASLTVAITSSRFAPAIAKFFQDLSRRTNGRVQLLRNVSLTQRPNLYTAHDLTFLPAECDNFGMCGLTSINSGTPVLTLALAPQTDFIYPESNGVLVKTKLDYDDNGVPHAIPNYGGLVTMLQTLIAEPWHIDNLNKRITYNLATRRKLFEQGWQAAMQLDK